MTDRTVKGPGRPDPALGSAALVEQTVAFMRKLRVDLTPGLSDAEIAAVQDEFGFVFGPDHRALLQLAQPTGDLWTDWRNASRSELQGDLDWPIDSLMTDIERGDFWPRSWGTRPTQTDQAVAKARTNLATWPKMVPLYGHRYLPAAPAPSGTPVFSIYHRDVIFYGSDVRNYVLRELQNNPETKFGSIRHHIPGWSDLAHGAEDEEL